VKQTNVLCTETFVPFALLAITTYFDFWFKYLILFKHCSDDEGR